ncbi:Cellulase (glycosyl hydrolase family 5) [Rubripirellula obstinata]|uniref:Cellulase (Glycosyl hydrolase family 5) n=2 Tax=Rubripirellula obstinata TaxID=406547 RepID=A0A5B1CH00_9BACT|nr:cellulase family glycosylhydrolase [Rubripirellula obstinata]KAA1259019.1 Cellulase (glycosyl hydrolase family 5) [Rubripirellula obstinata]
MLPFGLIVLSLLNQLLMLLAFADATLPPGDPPRVIVRDMSLGKTVVGSQGELLRGATVAYFKFRRETVGQPGYPAIDYATDPAFWDRMSETGINAVRLVFFDGWQRSHGDPNVDPFRPFPFTSLSPADALLQGAATQAEANEISRSDRRNMLRDFDTIVNLAAERNIYLMINYHDTTGYKDPNFITGLQPGQRKFSYTEGQSYLYQFWNRIAPRYANRTHVFYELMNEPVGFHPNNYTADDVFQMSRLFKRVRLLAPDTHLSLATFTTPASFNNRTMLRIAVELDQSGVDFTNASIAFHPYDISNLPHVVQPIAQTMRRYPVINTEQGLPASLKLSEEEPDAPGYFYHLLGSRTMERMNVSWFAWNTFETDQFENVWTDIFQADAILKNYYWGTELMLAEAMSRLENSMNPEAQAAYMMAKPLFDLYTNDPNAELPE